MSTKVKGEAIKEGSIPLSALATEVKEKIENAGGGADWNAQEGEAGYIDNKPFFSPIDEQEFLTWNNNNTIDEDLDSYDLIIKIGNFNSNKTLDVKTYRVKVTSENKPFYFFYNGYRYTITYQSYNLRVLDESGRHAIDGVNVKIYNYEGLDDNVKLLDSAYLSNDVIKTTPQELSDYDKNQALDNLGIDPVVWNYICNPFMLVYDYTISDEVHNMIWYKEASSLRSVILNTAQVFYNGEPYKINKLISTNRLGIITSDGEVIYEYDYKIKQFKIVE